ncbi:MAG: putative Ig domain-containing protein, partial [Bacteroidales bacterium]|nr:putative Ig domain-containing protein [Bacteroidales bacterium]
MKENMKRLILSILILLVLVAGTLAQNLPPVFISVPVTEATEEVLYEYTAVAEDVDELDVLTYSAPDPLPAWLTFNPGNQLLSGTPGNEDVGAHEVTIRVNDGTVDVDQVFTITVSNVNDPPVFTTVPDTVATEDVLYLSSVTATDADIGDVLTYSAPLLPAWLLFDAGTQVLSGTPGNSEVGYHSVTLRVNDGTVDVDTTFTIHVYNANDAPVF